MRITSKRQFYALWERDLLGNRPRTWTSREALAASTYTGLVSCRSVGSAGGGATRYGLTVREALEATATWAAPTFNEASPDEHLTIQGEVMRAPVGLVLTYDCTPSLRMRDAMKRAVQATGLTAREILRSRLSPASYDDIIDLLDLYDGHVIEFSTYSRNVGRQPHRNTLVWEVRCY